MMLAPGAHWRRSKAAAFFWCVAATAIAAAALTGRAIAASNVCADAPHHEFDFWIGEWDSFDQYGVLQCRLVVRPILEWCVLEELWTGTDGGTGRSFSLYDLSRKVWNQTWVSSHGTLLPIEGRLVGNAMVLTGNHVQPDGTIALHRTVWTPLSNGNVRQIWDYTTDGAATWTVNYYGLLKRHREPSGQP